MLVLSGEEHIDDSSLSRYARAAAGGRELGPAHQALLERVPEHTHVLDVGCSTGYLAERLAARGCEVVGIEIDHADAVAAREVCARVIEGDVEALDLAAQLGSDAFDVIIFGDVLEHLRAPEQTLRTTQRFLSPGGRMVVSIPNVAHASIRLQLLLGEFRYTPVGLLDETHLRFFTLDTFSAMAWRAGFAVTSLTRIEEPVNPELWNEVVAYLQLDAPTTDRLWRYLAQPSAATFQYILELSPASEQQAPPPRLEQPSWSRPLADYVAGRDELIRQLQEQVESQTAWALNSAEEIGKRDQVIEQLKQQLAEQTDWALRSSEAIRTRDEIIIGLNERLAEQTNWALKSSEEVRTRDEIIIQLQQQLAKQTAWAEASVAQLRGRDEIISRLKRRLGLGGPDADTRAG